MACIALHPVITLSIWLSKLTPLMLETGTPDILAIISFVSCEVGGRGRGMTIAGVVTGGPYFIHIAYPPLHLIITLYF